MTQIPAYPFRLDPVHGLALVDDGSPEDIRGTALAVLRTPLGWHDSTPDLGLPELAGSALPPEELTQVAVSAITLHDDRATVLTTTEVEDMLTRVNLDPVRPADG